VIVVDTNILVHRCLPSSQSEGTNAVLALDPQWAAPHLWRSEFRNVLCGYLRSGRLDAAEAERVIDRAASLLLGGEHFVQDRFVWELAARSRCTAYDCEFAGLAAALGTILVTEDRALLSAFPRLCRSLEDVSGERHPK
jgi:predicted nucleic acid-binding protein